MRWRLIEHLVGLAAPGEDQIAYVVNPDPRMIGQSVWAIAGEFWEWAAFLPGMVEAGVVPPDLARKVEHVVDGARVIRDAGYVAWTEHGSTWFYTTEVLRSDRLWAEVRLRGALSADKTEFWNGSAWVSATLEDGSRWDGTHWVLPTPRDEAKRTDVDDEAHAAAKIGRSMAWVMSRADWM